MLDTRLWPSTTEAALDGTLVIGGVRADDLAREYGTPLYVLDRQTVLGRAGTYRHTLSDAYPGPGQVHYASKAYISVALAQILHGLGLHFDVSSAGEFAVGRRAGVPPGHLHLHGNAKPESELRLVVDAGIGSVIVDNLDELRLVGEVAEEIGTRQQILLRLAPDVAAFTHRHIETGRADSKFGMPIDRLDTAAQAVLAAPNLEYAGLHCHLGSQLDDLRPYRLAVDRLAEAAVAIRESHGMVTRIVSPGGGLGIPYRPEDRFPTIAEFVSAVAGFVVDACDRYELELPTLVLEPGRSLVGPAMIALYRVVSTKPLADGARYLHLDGGIGDNIRPALYQAPVWAVTASDVSRRAEAPVHLAGRYCESGDVMGRDLTLGAETGDLVALANAGAYTLAMASSYNQVPRPAVVMVEAGEAVLIQRRETHEDLLARDLPLS